MPSDAEEIRQLKLDVARLGALVDALYVRLDGIAPDGTAGAADPANPPADVVEALRNDQLIVAIKLYREHFDVGLAEAKNAVENLQRSLGL